MDLHLLIHDLGPFSLIVYTRGFRSVCIILDEGVLCLVFDPDGTIEMITDEH